MSKFYNVFQTIMLPNITYCYLDDSEAPQGSHQDKQKLFCAAEGWIFKGDFKQREIKKKPTTFPYYILNQSFNQ